VCLEGTLTQEKSLRTLWVWMNGSHKENCLKTYLSDWVSLLLSSFLFYLLLFCVYGMSLTQEKSLQTLCVCLNAIHKGNCLKTYHSDWVSLLFSFFYFLLSFCPFRGTLTQEKSLQSLWVWVYGSHKGHCLTTYLSDWVSLLFSCFLFYLLPFCVFGGDPDTGEILTNPVGVSEW
jgi:hypothetical protein